MLLLGTPLLAAKDKYINPDSPDVERCGRRPKGTDFIGVGSLMQLMKTQYRVEHLASGRAVLSDKDFFQSRYA
jgi:hypothetical protein